MGQLQTVESQITALGFQILAISPDPPMKLKFSAQQHGLNYRLLSDQDRSAAKAFGIAFGETRRILPVPAVFLVGKSGKIEFQYVNPDYKLRLHPAILLAAAKSISEAEE